MCVHKKQVHLLNIKGTANKKQNIQNRAFIEVYPLKLRFQFHKGCFIILFNAALLLVMYYPLYQTLRK